MAWSKVNARNVMPAYPNPSFYNCKQSKLKVRKILRLLWYNATYDHVIQMNSYYNKTKIIILVCCKV